MPLLESTFINLLHTFSYLVDVFTYPLFYVLQGETAKLRRSKTIRAVADSSGNYRCLEEPELTTTPDSDCSTFAELFEKMATIHSARQCLGTRQFFKEEDEVQPNGKVFKKSIMGEYEWKTFGQVLDEIKAFGRGLAESGLEPGDRVLLFAETRADWMVAAQACFRQNFPVVTLYATLGQEAIVHGINETEVTHVITSADLLPKFSKLMDRIPTVKHITYMQGKHPTNHSNLNIRGVTVESMQNVIQSGSVSNKIENPPNPDSLAVVMYTSGSTGLPKGVLLSHRNCLSAISGLSSRAQLKCEDSYVGYLPLAHILELCAEITVLTAGARIGYSSPNTLTDASTAIKKGCKGDVSILQPTLLACVPTVMDRIYKSVWDKVETGGLIKRILFKFALNYKKKWHRYGASTPLIDSVVMSGITSLLGGKVRAMISGGAPLSSETQEFIRLTLCCPVLQGYGLTETCSSGTVTDYYDLSVSHVGAPLSCTKLKLVDWEEGGYRSTDNPPRGEVWIGGPCIALGYFKNEEKTREEFKQIDGIRWFATGDIGVIRDDGTLQIIDRKKDLVKLQAGEYVSLGKVEANLKLSPVVDNICVFASPMKTFTIAVVVPNPKTLQTLADNLNITGDWNELCTNTKINQVVLKQIREQGLQGGLEKFEIPQRITLTPELWTPDTGLVTDSLKLKRKPLSDHYKADVERMYN